MRTTLILLFVQVITFGIVNAQENIPMKTWRTHYSYKNLVGLSKMGDKIYAYTDRSLFNVNIEDGSTNILSKIDGLSETRISALGYSAEKDIKAIGYKSGNMDFIASGEIINLPTIKEATLTEDKTIYDIKFVGDSAIVSLGFGIAIIDFENRQVKETYQNIGPDAEVVPVYETLILGDSIYAATDTGVAKARFSSSVNLLDFNNWTFVDTLFGIEFRSITAIDGELYASSPDSGIFQFKNRHWSKILDTVIQKVSLMEAFNGQLLIISNNSIYTYDGSSLSQISNGLIQNPQEYQAS